MPDLELKNVSKYYGKIKALDNVSLRISDKEYVCILGPSGCGKSTLIKCVAGINQPDEGEICIDGRPVERLPIEDRKIGYVFQDIALFPHMSVRDNVSYGLAVTHTESARLATVSSEMLDLINMRERAKSYPTELSGGAQQKVAVARAIATGSRLFLLDEPLGALDALVRAELRYELRKLASDLGLTVIHVTHDQEEALSIADRVVVMKSGRIAEVGAPAEIYLSPHELFTENFVGESNLLEGEVAESNETRCTINVEGVRFQTHSRARNVGQRVIMAVRPESIRLMPDTSGGIAGRIKQVTFLGSLLRYVVSIRDSTELVVTVPNTTENRDFQEGESVGLAIPDAHILLFDYPAKGLENEIALD